MMTPSSKPRAWLWLALLAPMAVVGTAALLIALGFVFNASGESEPLGEDERNLLLDIHHVARWTEGYRPQLDHERISKTRFVDDSYEIEYLYDAPVDVNAPYLAYSITFEGTESNARTTYTSFWGGTHVGLLIGEGESGVLESNDLFRWGDESRFGILTAEGHPFGNVFLARRGTCVVYFLLSGLYFDEPEVVEELLSPYLQRLDAM